MSRKREILNGPLVKKKLGSNFINLVNNGLKAGIREVQLLKVLGLPF